MIRSFGNKAPFRYERIYQTLNDKIASGKYRPESRLPSEPELAKCFSVNQLTVRRALSRLEQEGKISRQHGRGTFIRDPHDARLNLLYIGETRTHLHQDQYLALNQAAQKHNYRLMCVETTESSRGELDPSLPARLKEADVVITSHNFHRHIAPSLNKKHRLIIIGDYLPEYPELTRPAYCVLSNRSKAVEMAVDYLVSLGHHRIALVTAGEWVMPMSQAFRTHYIAYRAALLAHDIRDYNVFLRLGLREEFLAENAAKLKKIFSSRNPPTAFVCESDYRARALYMLAGDLGLNIPRDFSIVGMNDTPWCTAWIPELTSVNFCPEETARIVMLYCTCESPAQTVICRIEPRLVVRQSCAPYAKSSKSKQRK